MSARRDLLKGLVMAGLSPVVAAAIAPSLVAGEEQTPPGSQVGSRDREFWETFLQREMVPASSVTEPRRLNRDEDTDREPFFFYHSDRGFQPALDLTPDQLMPGGDLQVKMNVAAFKPANEDRATFERLQNAQLRLDLVKTNPLWNFIDPMAWTAVAALHPTKAGKLPPLQNLSFDPGSGSGMAQGLILPGGEGRWAVNLAAQRKDSLFTHILRVAVPEIGRFAQFIGLPGISVAALNSFNAFYGVLHDKPEFLFKGAPVAVYGTASALQASGSSKGVPLRTGTYVLVPAEHAPKMSDDRLKELELKNGFLVPRGTNTKDLYVAAAAPSALPDVTYITVEMSVRPAPAIKPATAGL